MQASRAHVGAGFNSKPSRRRSLPMPDHAVFQPVLSHGADRACHRSRLSPTGTVPRIDRHCTIAMHPPAVRTAASPLARGARGCLHTSAQAHPAPARRWTERVGESRRIWARAPAVRTEEAARARCYVLLKHRAELMRGP
ncbi:hypothetical protein T492DRAFT_977831 [Pavlovales sp. CCMP2436]|nr:hypothetical protein T492DRAFT_977831 [Pavlovales sp. CCMP2436]